MGHNDDPSSTPSAPIGSASTGKEMFRGSAWMVSLRWTMRGIGVISTLILVRLLTPEDFGLIAMAMVGIGFLEVFTHAGVDLALIRDSSATREHFDSAWTMEILLGSALALALVLAAPLAGMYFDEPRVVIMIRVLAIRAVVGGFENIGVVSFRRNLDFRAEFRFEVTKKALNFVTTIALAIILRNYWALVISMVVARMLAVGLSYAVHPYRPRLSLARAADLWTFSGWLILSRVGRYLNGKVDRFVLGGLAGATPMGNYHVAAEVATAPTDELVFPMARGLFPVFSKITGNPKLLASSFRDVFSAVSMLCIALGFGMAIVAEDLVRVLLGEDWLSAIPLVQALALFGATSGITGSCETLLTVMGRVRALAALTWLGFAIQIPVLWFAGSRWGPEGVAFGRVGVAVGLAPLVVWVATIGFPLAPRHLVGPLVQRLAAGGVMLFAVRAVHMDSVDTPAVRLAIDTIAGALAFAGATVLLWKLRGSPDGPEKAVMRYLGPKLRIGS